MRTLSGAQLKALLEEQFQDSNGKGELRSSTLVPSSGFQFVFDLSRPQGSRITGMNLNGTRIDATGRYRVTVNNFLASGGDGYSVLTQGTDTVDAGLDLDALEAWLATNPAVPTTGRIRDSTPQ